MHASLGRSLIAAIWAVALAAAMQPTPAQQAPGSESFIVEDTSEGAEPAQDELPADEPVAGKQTAGEPDTEEAPSVSESPPSESDMDEPAAPELSNSVGITADSVAEVGSAPVTADTNAPKDAGCILERDTLDGVVEETYAPVHDEGTTIQVVNMPEAPPAREERSMRDYTVYPRFSAGLRLSYFHYSELFPADELIEFVQRHNSDIVRFVGWPKSDEHGVCEGIELEFVQPIPGTPLFLRPKLGAALGIMHTYDGSLQGERDSTPDTLIVTYEPYVDRKNNFFLHGGAHIGGGYFGDAVTALAFTGFDLHWWSRTFATSYFEEYYYWVNIPLGLLVDVALPGGWAIGFEPQVAFMLAGRMRAVLDFRGPFNRVSEFPPFELSYGVPFKKRYSFGFKASVRKRLSPLLSLRVVPSFEYYHFERSNVQQQYYSEGIAVVYEPASRTFTGGLGLDVMFHRRDW